MQPKEATLTNTWFHLPEILPAAASRFRRLFSSVSVRRRKRQLRLCETLSLGEKRLLAVVQFKNRRYLVGATGSSMTLLADLSAEDSVPGSGVEAERNDG